MNNAKHYFKPEWNSEFYCAQCGEYITADRHIRAPRIGLLATLKPQGRKAK